MSPWVWVSRAPLGGVFQSFSDFVMKGLASAEPASGMDSMQQVNRAVFRSVFLATFLALVPATVAFGWYAWVRVNGSPRMLIATAAVVYVLFVFLVTVAGNVPMNEHLDKLDYSSVEGRSYWAHYCRVWTWWNHLRTVGSVATAVCLLLAAVQLAAAPVGSLFTGQSQ